MVHETQANLAISGHSRMSLQHVKHIRTKRWQRLRKQVFFRDKYRCQHCRKPGRLECDHVVPLQNGGEPYALENLQALCRRCHLDKTAQENRRALTPAEKRWRSLVTELM